jgi:hypothetical protein
MLNHRHPRHLDRLDTDRLDTDRLDTDRLGLAGLDLDELGVRAAGGGLDSLAYLDVVEAIRRALDRLETAVIGGPPSVGESTAVVTALRRLAEPLRHDGMHRRAALGP